MSKQAHRHRARDLRKKRRTKAERAADLANATLPQVVPRGKGVPVIICGHTLSEIARALDLDQSYLSRLSLGKASPSLEVARRLQAYLELDSIDAVLAVFAPMGAAAKAAARKTVRA